MTESAALSERQREVIAKLASERSLEPSLWRLEGGVAIYRDERLELSVGATGTVVEVGDDDDGTDAALAILDN